MKRVIIIGGGISGLAAAYRLQELTSGQACEIILLEASPHFGGAIQSEVRDGFILEGGPDCFISEKPAALRLAKKLGLESEILETNPRFRRSFIYVRNRLVPVPQGFYLMAPRNLAALFATPLLSLRGKLRMACEPWIPARGGDEDESVSAFVRRRLGREALEKIAQPMIGGIYTADPEKLSLMATFPKFREMERLSGGVIRGLGKTAAGVKEASGPRYGLFLSFKKGMQTLPDALVKKLDRVTLRASFSVSEIFPQAGRWRILGEKGENLEADAVCLTVPAYRAARLLKNISPEPARELAAIPYESVLTLNVIYRKEKIGHSLEGFGFVIPDQELKKIMACTFASVKFAGRAPEGFVLLRVFAGGALRPGVFNLTDDAFQRVALEELSEILDIQGPPVSVSVRRWPLSMPQYHVGHLDRVRTIEEKIKEQAGLFLTGNAYRGVGIPDCIEQAESAAENIFNYLRYCHSRESGNPFSH